MKRIKFRGKPKLIDLTSETILPDTLTEYKVSCAEDEKILYLYHYIKHHSKQSFIIFTNTINSARKVTNLMRLLNEKVVCMHSEMQQRQRLKKLDQFTSRSHNIIVCTDVASRGLDIPLVEHVVHFQLPKDLDTYIHRCGRTARIGKQGTTFSLVGPTDEKKYIYFIYGGKIELSVNCSLLDLLKIIEKFCKLCYPFYAF